MLLSLRKNGLTSLFKEVRVLKGLFWPTGQCFSGMPPDLRGETFNPPEFGGYGSSRHVIL